MIVKALLVLLACLMTYVMNFNTKKAGYEYNQKWYWGSYVITALATALFLYKVDLTWSTGVITMMMPALVVSSCIDIKLHIIPNRLQAYLAILALGYAALNYKIAWILLLGGAVYFLLFLFLSIITGGNLGMGDVKLGFSIGAILGLTLIVKYLAFSFILAGVIAFVLLITKKKKLNDKMAFGPYLAAGFILVLLTM